MQKKIIIWIAAFFIMVNVTLVMLVIFSGQGKPAPVKLPVPNGYDDFVAGAMKVSGNLSGYATNSREQLSVLVSNNAEALRLITRGLGEECRVPVEYNENFRTTLTAQLQPFKNAAYVLAAEGRLAELEGRTNDAIKGYLNGIRFGQEIGRGGLLMHRLVAVACERLASTRLEYLIDKLDAENCRAIVQTLETIDGKEEPTKETLKQEENWIRGTSGLKERFFGLLTRNMRQKAMDAAAAKFNANTLQRRELMAKFAERAYELEKGKRAATMTELVPTYLKAIPKDPETGKDLSVTGQSPR